MSETNQNGSLIISREFAARLNRLSANQKVRAMVMLQTGDDGETQPCQVARQERRQRIEAIRQAARAALPEIDRILETHGGSRLSEDVDALGSLMVETTADGVRALADSKYVKAILEDQPIFTHPEPKR